jgi:endonuclease/exonuclease/phosphatase (EEP) superfamily protein YafD
VESALSGALQTDQDDNFHGSMSLKRQHTDSMSAASSERASERGPSSLTWLAMLASAGLAVATVLPRAAPSHWAIDLLAHFPVQIAIAAFFVVMLLLLLRRPKLAIFPLLVLIANAWPAAALYFPTDGAEAEGATYRVVSANVLARNRNYAALIDFIRVADPDFFFVLEMNGDWLEAVRELEGRYPYSVVAPREDNFGIGLFSRAPITRREIHMTPEAEVPSIVATLALGEGELTVIGTHPVPPMSRERAYLRNLQLGEIGRVAAELPEPTILVGDLNVTSWSPHFAGLLKQTQLRDARRGYGIQPSWPNFPWPLRIPIDHTLVSHDIRVADRSLGPDIGSDHLPVILDFQLTGTTP